MTRLAQFFGILLSAACLHSGESVVPNQKSSLEKGLESLATGSDPSQIAQAIRWFGQALEKDPGNRQAQGGLSQALGMAGYLEDNDRDQYRLAREIGLKCMLSDPGFQARLNRSGGLLTSVVLERVDGQRWDCLYWTTWAWARWIYARGPVAMEIDHAVIQAMAVRLRELAPEERKGDAIGLHGLTLSLSSEKHEMAQSALKQAAALSPGDSTWVVDLAEYVLLPLGQEAETRQVLNNVIHAGAELAQECCYLRNKKAVDRADQLLQRFDHDAELPRGSDHWR